MEDIKKLDSKKLLKRAKAIMHELARRKKLREETLSDFMVCNWYYQYYVNKEKEEKGFG